MSESRRDLRFERIVVACDPVPGSGAVEAAVALAASLQAELAGLFVEDVNLLRMAGLPFSQELGLTSALMRPLDAAAIEREFRRHAEAARRALEHAAVASSVRWSFQVIRGEPFTAALAAAREHDLLVVGAQLRPGGARGRPRAEPEAVARRMRPVLRPVAVVFNGLPLAAHALALAAALAAHAGATLTVWVAADSEPEFASLRDEARALFPGSGAVARIRWLRVQGLRAVAEAVSAEAPGVLVWHDGLDSGQLRALLAAARCTLILVR